MFKLKISKAFRTLAGTKGVKIPATGNIDAEASVQTMAKTLKAKGGIHAFVVPPIGISPQVALSAGAKILSQGANAQEIITHTRALAAMGDKDAARGLSALMTAQKFKAEGVKIPPPPKAVKPMVFKKTFTDVEVNALLAKPKAAAIPLTVWVKIKRWIGARL